MTQNNQEIKRRKYRTPKNETNVKAYTLNQESRYLIVRNVPSVASDKDLIPLFALYGDIEEYRILDHVDSEPFTDTYWIKFALIPCARYAKRKLNKTSFFSSLLHVSYAPEYETLQDTRAKLEDRRQTILHKLRSQYSKLPPEFFPMKPLPSPSSSSSSSSPTTTTTTTTKTTNVTTTTTTANNNNNNSNNNVNVSLQKVNQNQSVTSVAPSRKRTASERDPTLTPSMSATVLAIRNKLRKISKPVLPPSFSKPNTIEPNKEKNTR